MFLFVVLVLLLVQPIFSTLLQNHGEYRPRRQMYNRIAWMLAVVIAGLWIAVSYRFTGLGVELWGVWLYFGVGVGMLVVELSTLVAKSR